MFGFGLGKLVQWIKEVLTKMISTTNVTQALHVDIALSPWMTNALITWSEMYMGRAAWLTTGSTNAGFGPSGHLAEEVRSLNLPATIASEIARMATMEMQVELSGGPRATFLAEQLERIIPLMRTHIEYGCAKGGLMLKPYVSGNQIFIDFVQADQFYPIGFDANKNIVACAFADPRQFGKEYYQRLEYHELMKDGTYKIINKVYKSNSPNTLGMEVPFDVIHEWADLVPELTLSGISKPLYGYFRYPMANHIDPTSALGVSCYSRAVQLVEAADRQWSNLLWEFKSGERALYVDTDALDRDQSTGKPILPKDRLYRVLNPTGDTSLGKDGLFEDWSPTFREVSLINGLNRILIQIEEACGLAAGTLSNPNDVARTATELKIMKQRSYATVTDTQKAIQEALEQALYAMDVWATIYNLAPQGTFEASYSFDDSVVKDHDVQAANDRQDVTARLQARYEYRMRNYGETEAVAKQRIAEIDAENAADSIDSLFPNEGGNKKTAGQDEETDTEAETEEEAKA